MTSVPIDFTRNERPTVGVELEVHLVDARTGDLVSAATELLEAMGEGYPGGEHPKAKHELFQSTIEIITGICDTPAEARLDLQDTLDELCAVAQPRGVRIASSGTHPFATARAQDVSPDPRYHELIESMQWPARRLLICGMHVHVGIDDDEMRVDLMRQFSYFLPHLLALSCSSPFWEGDDTGLRSYRLTVFDALPRTGIPERFSSFAEYRRHVDVLINAGVIEDATKIWWDVRPSARYPTLETRVMDVCTRLEDAVCIAALIVSTLRMLWRLRARNQSWRNYAPMLISENRWRAMRYGTDEGLLDFGTGEIVAFEALMKQLIELIYDDAQQLGCTAEIEHALVIAQRGTSAHEQLRVYSEAIAAGDSRQSAMRRVVDHLAAVTGIGVDGSG
jgi:carboxylate-amine ligase